MRERAARLVRVLLHMGSGVLMRRNTFVFLVAGILAAGSVSADTFDHEVDLSFSSFDSDAISFPVSGGVPDPTQGSSTTSTSDDELAVSWSWFYSGLSDEEGPRSRAEFVSRASGLSLTYARLDGDSSFASNFFGFSISGSGEQTADTVGVDVRQVWKDSGWYVQAGIARSSADASFTDSQGNTADGSAEGEVYVLGLGKYLGPTTALDIVLADAEIGGSSNPNVAVSLSHIGALGEDWQYGADFGAAFADDETRAYKAQFSLYPNRDIAFGLGYTRLDDDNGFSVEGSTVSGFASWFVNEKTVVRASFSSGDTDALGTDGDSDSFSIGVSIRY